MPSDAPLPRRAGGGRAHHHARRGAGTRCCSPTADRVGTQGRRRSGTCSPRPTAPSSRRTARRSVSRARMSPSTARCWRASSTRAVSVWTGSRRAATPSWSSTRSPEAASRPTRGYANCAARSATRRSASARSSSRGAGRRERAGARARRRGARPSPLTVEGPLSTGDHRAASAVSGSRCSTSLVVRAA